MYYNMLTKCDLSRADKGTVCDAESQVPPTAGDEVLLSSHNGSTTDWDSWAKQLLALLDKAMLGDRGVNATTAMPDREIAERPMVDGELVPARVVSLQSKGQIRAHAWQMWCSQPSR